MGESSNVFVYLIQPNSGNFIGFDFCSLSSVLTVSLERSEYIVSEGVGDVTAAVLLEGVTAVNVSVYLTTIDSGNATGGENSVANFYCICTLL